MSDNRKRVYDLKKDEELNTAYWEAARGAARGGATWGMAAAILGTGAYTFSPLYRGLTVQFKVFLQISAMTLGALIHADRRLIAHEKEVRHANRRKRDIDVWKAYEQQFEAEEARREMLGMRASKRNDTARSDAGSSEKDVERR